MLKVFGNEQHQGLTCLELDCNKRNWKEIVVIGIKIGFVEYYLSFLLIHILAIIILV